MSGADPRSTDAIRRHYEVERELADRLRHASPERRRALYTEVYDELYERVKDHPYHLEDPDSPGRRALTEAQLRGLEPHLAPDHTVMEIGPGGGALALQLAKRVRQVFLVDVSDAVLADIADEPRIRFFRSDGASVPVPPDSVDVALSHQVMEHLHPDDALEQLHGVFAALAPGGVYLCFTPNRLTGPYDVSRGFDPVATGMHLREYTNRELTALLRDAGFGRIRYLFGSRGRYVPMTTRPVRALERLVEAAPHGLARPLAHSLAGRVWLSGVKLAAYKPR